MRIACRIAEAAEHRIGLEGPVEERHNQNTALVTHTIDGRPGADRMGCFPAILQEHHHSGHSRPEAVGIDHPGEDRGCYSEGDIALEAVDIVHPGEGRGCYFEGDILEAVDTVLEAGGTVLVLGLAGIDLGIDPREDIGCTSRSFDGLVVLRKLVLDGVGVRGFVTGSVNLQSAEQSGSRWSLRL